MKLPVSIIILTHNEEKNIQACLESIADWAENIFIIDSFSQDRTIELALKYTKNIYKHEFVNYSKQFNWALENLPIKTEWVMRLDADEQVMPMLKDEIVNKLLKLENRISGIYVKRRVYFMNKWIRYGGYYPTWLLRIWRTGQGICEERWMDEHIKVTRGETTFFKNDIIDKNNKDLSWWVEKHNKYATREAIDVIKNKYLKEREKEIQPKITGTQEQKKRWVKENVYLKTPLFLRAFLYFIYRYIFKLGFLDGKEGLIWHFLQGLWYRFLVDAKIYQIEIKINKEKISIKQVIDEMTKNI